MAEILLKAPIGKYKYIVENSFEGLGDEVKKLVGTECKMLIISDSNVWNEYGNAVSEIFEANEMKADKLIVDSTEEPRCAKDLKAGFDKLMADEYSKDDYIIGFGGDVVSKYAGFLAATFKSTMNLIYIPTSVISMAESTTGGKCSLEEGTETYCFPKLVFANVSCLNTLSESDYYSGFSRIMKTAIVKSASVYEWLIDKLYEISDREPGILLDMIEQNVNLRRIYLDKDLYCKQDQMLFGLGETVASAIASVKGDELSSGDCLTLGILAAAHISMKRDMLSLDEYLEIRDMFVPFNLPISVENVDVDELTSLIRDRLNINPDFILLKKIGKAVTDRNISDEEIKAALGEIRFSDDDYVVD